MGFTDNDELASVSWKCGRLVDKDKNASSY